MAFKMLFTRIILLTSLVIALFIWVIFGIVIPVFEENFYAQKKEMIRELANSAWNILAKFEAEERKGILTREQAQNSVKAQIRSLYYGSTMKDYFWINDYNNIMVIHPYRPDLDGKNLTDFKDPSGKKLFVEMTDVVKKSGSGYITYMWQHRDDSTRVVPKLSYVKGFAPWSWIIGTGVYIDDIHEEVGAIKQKVIYFFLMIIFISTIILLYLMKGHLNSELGRIKALEDLKRSEKKYRSLVENNTDIIMRFDNQARIIYSNSSIEKYLEVEAEELNGVPPSGLKLPAGLCEFFEVVVKKVVDTRAEHGAEFSMRCKTGDTVFSWLLYPEFEESKAGVCHILCIGRDITENKRNEEIIRQQVKELEVKNTELGSFNYTVSHELKSPIITIEGYLGLITEHLKQGKSDRIASYIQKIDNATHKMHELLECLLKLSKIGRITCQFEKFSMAEMINETLELLSGIIINSRVKIDVAPGMPEIKADRQRMREVFQNLIENAIKYMGGQPEPRVEIGFSSGDGMNRFFVKDNGIGIEKTYFGKLFKLFEKLNPRSEGSGIGLALTKKIIDFHGGRIWVESEGKDKGCTFFFTIPIEPVDSKKQHDDV